MSLVYVLIVIIAALIVRNFILNTEVAQFKVNILARERLDLDHFYHDRRYGSLLNNLYRPMTDLERVQMIEEYKIREFYALKMCRGILVVNPMVPTHLEHCREEHDNPSNGELPRVKTFRHECLGVYVVDPTVNKPGVCLQYLGTPVIGFESLVRPLRVGSQQPPFTRESLSV